MLIPYPNERFKLPHIILARHCVDNEVSHQTKEKMEVLYGKRKRERKENVRKEESWETTEDCAAVHKLVIWSN